MTQELAPRTRTQQAPHEPSTKPDWRPLRSPELRTYFPARNTSGSRPRSAIRSVVLHCTEGPTARGAASYFHSGPSTVGSAQLCVDDRECYRSVEDREVCWGAPPLNSNGLHVEQAGYTTYSKVTWSRTHRRMIRRVAWKVAEWCVEYDVPIKFLSVADLKREGEGARGITTHNNVSLAFHQSTHTDPGPNYPVGLLLWLVKRYAKRIRAGR